MRGVRAGTQSIHAAALMIAGPALAHHAAASAAMIGDFGPKRILIGAALVLPIAWLRWVDRWLRRDR